MSERPFMQLYVSDFVGDTLHLSTEQIGAYMLLLMAMWNAGGKLPADDQKLSRVVRMSVKKWRAISADLMAFFEGDHEHIWHNRLTKELQKSESKSQLRAAAGAKGAAAKTLKYQEEGQANASRLLKHSPDTISHIAASQQRAPDLIDRLLEAAGIVGNEPTGMAFPGEILGLLQAGFDLDADILPAIRAKPNPNARTWAYFVPQIREAAQRKASAAATPAPKRASVDWEARLKAFHEQQIWPHSWGPKPGEPGCGAPSELVRRIAA